MGSGDSSVRRQASDLVRRMDLLVTSCSRPVLTEGRSDRVSRLKRGMPQRHYLEWEGAGISERLEPRQDLCWIGGT
jgi:hypothetical protein